MPSSSSSPPSGLPRTPEGWQWRRLSDLVAVIVDNRGRTAPTAESGIPLIATNCIKEDGLFPVFEKIRFVSDETYANWFRGHPEPDDVIIVNKGSPGQTCLVPDPVGFCIAQDMVALRADPDQLTADYLLAALRSPLAKDQIAAYSVGTTIPHFKKTDFDKLWLPVPPLAESRRIGELYHLVGEKLELNRRTNRTLEAMARAIYKSWFIDFDGHEELAESEIGPIPRGWEVVRLGGLCRKIGSGATPRGGKSAYVETGTNLIRSQNVYDFEFEWAGLVHLRDNDAHRLRGVAVERDDVLINITGDSILRTCIVDPAVLPARVNQHVAIIRPEPPLPPQIVHLHLVHPRMKSWLLGHSAGGTRKAITKGHLEGVPVPLPPRQELVRMGQHLVPLYEKRAANWAESRTLAALRDTLLPKLVSGEIRVPEAQDAVETAS